MPASPMLAHAHREPSFLWITIERPTIHMLPRLPGVASNLIDATESMSVATCVVAPMPSKPNFPDRSPTSQLSCAASGVHVSWNLGL